MKLKEKLKKTKRNSRIGLLAIFLSLIYLLMIVIKGFYFLTGSSNFSILNNVNDGLKWVIEKTYFFPLSVGWENIAVLPLRELDVFGLYKIMIPPVLVILVGSLFVRDHQSLKAKFFGLKAKIEKEIALRELRKEAGLETISENPTVEVIISNTTNSDPSWQNTWWGKIIIGLAIVLIAAAVGLK